MEDGWRIRGGAAEVKDYDVSQNPRLLRARF